jgi:alcohol dehydrogenase YqhD (iron-dependent ADH family)
MLSHFVHRSAQTKVVFGPDAIAQLPAELGELGIRRPVVLTGPSTARSLVYERVTAALQGFDLIEFKEIPQHSSLTAVKAIMGQARAHRADGLIAKGEAALRTARRPRRSGSLKVENWKTTRAASRRRRVSRFRS